MSAADAPIGVFDSGVGGLSVLRSLRAELPAEDWLYFADSRHCPYGGQTAEALQARATEITERFLAHGAKLVVVACNTATIAAIAKLRARYALPFVGMEPGVKPACEQTRSGVVGVLATGRSLAGEKFHQLLATHARDVRVLTRPCAGWVETVEAGVLEGPPVVQLLRREVDPLLDAGCDVLVLGCTHYPFLAPALRAEVGPDVTLIDTGPAVARQVRRVLQARSLLRQNGEGAVEWATSGDPARFAEQRAALGF
jgi:glutamate racemase